MNPLRIVGAVVAGVFRFARGVTADAVALHRLSRDLQRDRRTAATWCSGCGLAVEECNCP